LAGDSLGKQVIRSYLDLARRWVQSDILSIKGTEEGPNSSGLPTTARIISLLRGTELELVSEDTEEQNKERNKEDVLYNRLEQIQPALIYTSMTAHQNLYYPYIYI